MRECRPPPPSSLFLRNTLIAPQGAYAQKTRPYPAIAATPSRKATGSKCRNLLYTSSPPFSSPFSSTEWEQQIGTGGLDQCGGGTTPGEGLTSK